MHKRNREVVILVIVSLMALAANLPDGALGHIVDRNLLLITLVATVVISLFRYLKLTLFITVSVLAIGANLPAQLASQLGISQPAMIVASGVLILVALLSYKPFHLRPLAGRRVYAEDAGHSGHDTIDSRNGVITAILNGDLAGLHQLLMSGAEVNFRQNGDIPLFLAIMSGYADIVLLLLSHGANIRVKNKEGQSPIEFALLHEQMRIAEIVRYASRHNLAVQRTRFPDHKKARKVILFADICGSTALYDKLGNETAMHVVTRTLSILTQEVATHRGTVIKTIGDEIMCSFPNVALAMQAATAMHCAVEANRPGGEQAVFVRIGFHYGEVIHKANDVFGDAVNIAARVTAVTRARQIMTTQAVIEALPPEFADRVRPVMRAAFRGKQDSFAVFQIIWGREDMSSGRIGQPAFRKHSERGNELFTGHRPPQRPPQHLDETITLRR